MAGMEAMEAMEESLPPVLEAMGATAAKGENAAVRVAVAAMVALAFVVTGVTAGLEEKAAMAVKLAKRAMEATAETVAQV